MVDVGWIPGDGPQYLRPVIGDQDETRRSEGPAIEIIIDESETTT